MWSFYVKIQVCWIVKHYKWTYFAFRSIFFHHSFGLLHQCLDLLVFGNDFFVTLERPKKLESSDEVSVSPMCEIQTFSCRNQINREQKPSSIWDNLNRPLVRMKSKKLSSMITWGKQGIYKSLQYTSILSVLSICPIYPVLPTGLSHLFVRPSIPSVCLPCPSRLSVRPSVHLIWPSVEHF